MHERYERVAPHDVSDDLVLEHRLILPDPRSLRNRFNGSEPRRRLLGSLTQPDERHFGDCATRRREALSNDRTRDAPQRIFEHRTVRPKDGRRQFTGTEPAHRADLIVTFMNER